MSGGSMNYIYASLEDYVGCFQDVELDDLLKDICVLLHDREWYDSGDYSEGDWNESIINFKQKWLEPGGHNKRWKKYIDNAVNELRFSLGLNRYFCKDCEWFKSKESSNYGKCTFGDAKPYLKHKYEKACDDIRIRIGGTDV